MAPPNTAHPTAAGGAAGSASTRSCQCDGLLETAVEHEQCGGETIDHEPRARVGDALLQHRENFGGGIGVSE